MPIVGRLNKFKGTSIGPHFHRTTSSMDTDSGNDSMSPLEYHSYICPDCTSEEKCERCQEKIRNENSFRHALASFQGCLQNKVAAAPTNTRKPEPQSDSIVEPSPCDQLTYEKEDVEFSVKNVKSEPEQTVELEFDTNTGMFIGSRPDFGAKGSATFQPLKKPKIEEGFIVFGLCRFQP